MLDINSIQNNIFTRKVCIHIHERKAKSYYLYFTGIEQESKFICKQCAEKINERPPETVDILPSDRIFIEEELNYYEFIGKPETKYQLQNISLKQNNVSELGVTSDQILDIQPMHQEDQWIAILINGEVIKINFENGTLTKLLDLKNVGINFNEPISLTISQDNQYAFIANILGLHGILVNLKKNKIGRKYARDGYHCDVTPYPAAFFLYDKQCFFITATKWNRLEIINPKNGKILSKRSNMEYVEKGKRPEHYLDYFHGKLYISPDQKWIVDNGWIWQPMGCIESWNLETWLKKNSFESEDGNTKKTYLLRGYFWGGPICWIDEQTMGVWGYGDEDENLIPAVLLFNITTGKLLGWFAGPETAGNDNKTWNNKLANFGGWLTFDKYLFTSSEKYGFSIWDINHGSCVYKNPEFSPIKYNSWSKQFLSFELNGSFTVTKIVE